MMEFTIKRDYFITQLNDTLKAISPRTTLPILTGIKIDAKEHEVILTGSDSEISIEITIPKTVDGEDIVNISETGSVVLPGRFFVDIIKKLPGKDVKLSTNEQFQTLITSGHSEFNLSGLDPDQYPLLPQVSRDDAIQLSVKVLKNVIAQTNFAVSTSETRPVLTGVNWLIQEKELICTATDSHRLAVRKLQLEDVSNQVLFKVGNVNFISRLLEGHYPDTTRLFPENNEIKLSIDNGEFYHAIDRASLLAREGGNNVIKLSTGDDVVELSSTSPEIGTVKEEVDANDVEGGNLKISFNSKYMMDALKAIDNDEVEVEFFGTMKPFILKPKGDDSVTQLILPIRTY
nr:DNA polymerase III subunit beta [Staphylococcus aureus]